MSEWPGLIILYLLIGAVLNVIYYSPGKATWAQQIIPRTLNIVLWPLSLIGIALLWRAHKIIKEKKDVATNRHGSC